MKKTLLLIIILNLGFVSFGQEWTWPVKITEPDKSGEWTDMIVDTNGIIHVVWTSYYSNSFSKILYKCSFDNGETWTAANDVSQNDTLRLAEPKIASNDSSEIFITYNYDSSKDVYLARYKEGQWQEPFLVSGGLSGKNYRSRAVLDGENRFYVFWWNTSMKYYYKYFENETWSNLFSPYGDSTGIHFFIDFDIDMNNNLHWAGGFPLESDPMKVKKTYYKYNKQEDNWEYPFYINNYYSYGNESDISLDTFQNPHFAWRERIVTSQFDNDFTLYKFFDGENWSVRDTVVASGFEELFSHHQIAIDGQNKLHIVQKEETEEGNQLVHYQKIDGEWIGEIIDESGYFMLYVKLAYFNNMLFLTYAKNNTQGNPLPVYFTRYDIVTSVEENRLSIVPNCKLYPNPFINKINIEFEIKQQDRVWVYVIDMQGNLIKELNNSALPPGNHYFEWTGTDMNNNPVANGSYLIRMVSGKYQLVKTVQLAN